MENIEMMAEKGINANDFGWKAYNIFKKKAVERGCSLAGLAVSLSIAFFVVFLSAQVLSFAHYMTEELKVNYSLVQELSAEEKTQESMHFKN